MTRLSFCITCKGRLHHLQHTLPINLRNASRKEGIEFVLLDYDSPDGLADWVQANMSEPLADGRLRYFRLHDRPQYDSSHAKNVAHLLAKGEVLCNLDADNYVSEQLIGEMLQRHEHGANVVTCGRRNANGRVSIRRDDFLKLGGYEETLTGWGHDDIDLLDRAKDVLGADCVNLARHDAYIRHSDAERLLYMNAISKHTSARSNRSYLQTLRVKEPLANMGRSWGVAKVMESFGTRELNVGQAPPPTATEIEPSPYRSHNTPPKSGNGVIYLLTGVSHAVRLLVSIWSLRKHYHGPVVVYTTRDESHRIGRLLAEDARLNVEHHQANEVDSIRNSSFLTKTCYFDPPPFEVCTHLDCDTLVVGDIGALFEVDETTPFLATQFSNWRTTDQLLSKRLGRWRYVDFPDMQLAEVNDLIDEALDDQPGINSGVFTFHHSSPIIRQWRHLAWAGRNVPIGEETALQLLLAKHRHLLLDTRYNCSVKLRPHRSDVRIWHFHGNSHLQTFIARQLWLPVCEEVKGLNLAKVNDWAPSGDSALGRELVMYENSRVG